MVNLTKNPFQEVLWDRVATICESDKSTWHTDLALGRNYDFFINFTTVCERNNLP